jgi:DNA relaxase NicK
MTDYYEVMEAGVDYLTISALPHQVAVIKKAAAKLCGQRERLGDQGKSSSALGYDGIQVGPVFFGIREDNRGLLRVSGPTAGEAFALVGKLGLHFTRIDIQMTIRPAGGLDNPDLAKTVLRESNERRAAKPVKNYAHVRLIDGNGRGDTAMIGSRSSGRYGRIYDKAAESGDERYDRCWRYELEFKQEYADEVRDILSQCVDVEGAVVDIIHTQMHIWEVPSFINRAHSKALRGAPSLPTDNERSLHWLRTQVLPTYKRLQEAGMQAELDELFNI